MEDMWLVAWELYDFISWDEVVFPPYVEVNQADGALGALLLVVEIEFYDVLFDLSP